MYLSTRMQRGLSASARTSPTTSGGFSRHLGSDRMWIENLDRVVWLRVRACPTS